MGEKILFAKENESGLTVDSKLLSIKTFEKERVLDLRDFDKLTHCDLDDRKLDREGRSLAALVLWSYKRVLSDPDSQIGQGNNGIVFSLSGLRGDKGAEIKERAEGFKCVKCQWKNITARVMTKENKPSTEPAAGSGKLPVYISKLFQVQKYFDIIKKRKKAITKNLGEGVGFELPNDLVQEAIFSQKARYLLQKAGSECRVPFARDVIDVSIEHDQWEVEPTKTRYYVNEKLSMLLMEQVRGSSLEDIMLGVSDKAVLPKDFDVEKFGKILREAINTINEGQIAHNDITLRNVMVDEGGNPWIIDFGVAKESSVNSLDLDGYEVVMRWLRAFVNNLEETRKRLKSEFAKFDKKF